MSTLYFVGLQLHEHKLAQERKELQIELDVGCCCLGSRWCAVGSSIESVNMGKLAGVLKFAGGKHTVLLHSRSVGGWPPSQLK